MFAMPVCVPALLLAACDRDGIRQRAEEIRERNAANERVCVPLAVRKVREDFFIRGNEWFGYMADGTRLRLESPKVTVEPIKDGRPYCCKWLGEITVTAERWRTVPPVEMSLPFSMTWTVLVQDSNRVAVTDRSGPEIAPISAEEAASFPPESTTTGAAR